METAYTFIQEILDDGPGNNGPNKNRSKLGSGHQGGDQVPAPTPVAAATSPGPINKKRSFNVLGGVLVCTGDPSFIAIVFIH